LKLSKSQNKVFRSNARYRVLVTGRRWGKTEISINELCKFAAYRPHRKPRQIWYIAPYYTQAKEIAWLRLKDSLVEKGWVQAQKSFNESALSATIANGNIIKLKGANNPDALRGSGLAFVVIDEFQDMKQEAWTEVIRPMLSDTKGHAFMCGTPKGFNWAYDLWAKGQKNRPEYTKDWESWQFTTIDGGNVLKEEIEDAKRDLDERTFRQEYEASFETYSGVVYYAFGHIESLMPFKKPEDFDRVPLHIGMDFNVSPMAATISIENELYTHVIDEITIYSSNTHEMSEEIRNRYKHNPIYVYPDPACKQRRTSAGGNTDLKILQDSRYRFNPRLRSAHPLIRDRVNAVNSRFKTASGERKLFIDPKCRQLIKCVTNQLYKEGTMLPDKTSDLDHMPDALGYHIEYVHPVVTEDYGRSFSPLG